MDNTIYVTTLGDFSIKCNKNIVSDSINRAYKPRNFLAYLLVNKNKEILSSEVAELIWDEKSESSARGSIKVLVHRVRAFLAPLANNSDFTPISFKKGIFTWNYPENTVLDYEVFEDLLQRAHGKNISDTRRIELYQEALALYKGNFLHTNKSTWTESIRNRLHTAYVNAVCEMVELCYRQAKYPLAVAACQRALYIEKNDETLYYHLIKSMYLAGDRREALEKYHETTEVFYKEFGITPSNEIKLLYREITKALNVAENSILSVQAELRESFGSTGAFFCEYEIFKDIYQLTERGCRRSGETAFLCLLTLFSDIDDSVVPQDIKHYNRCMDELKHVVQETLRRRDVYTRYSLTQYLILLNDVTMENAFLITERIERSYKRLHPVKDVKLTSKIAAIDVTDI
ncbi:MAG: bacterial transcriptional activator domain-containing protein [Lachnospiraceae bacterium]|nr:bacterial transcriptional activator domain-containing protein [Lachnospiraceae bacterium]